MKKISRRDIGVDHLPDHVWEGLLASPAERRLEECGIADEGWLLDVAFCRNQSTPIESHMAEGDVEYCTN